MTTESSSPAAPPATDSSRLSIRSCVRIWRREAPDRQPDRDLLLARDGAGNQQIGHVEAGDQQHQADHAHQNHQRGGIALAHLRVPRCGRLHAHFARQKIA